MAIQLRSGKDLRSNKRTKRKEETEEKKEETKAEKEETEKEGEKNSRKEVMTRKRRKEYQLIHLQCHFHRDFRSQEEKNSFPNSWTFSRKQK